MVAPRKNTRAGGRFWLSHSCGILLVLWWSVPSVRGLVFTHNATDVTAVYPSLPGSFGATWEDGSLYKGRLQFLPQNPYLCDDVQYQAALALSDQPADGATPPPPLVVLAARGQCSLRRKAEVAEQAFGPHVQFLILYNRDDDGEDVLVPLYQHEQHQNQHHDLASKLWILSVSYRTGTLLQQYHQQASSPNSPPLLTMTSDAPFTVGEEEAPMTLTSAQVEKPAEKEDSVDLDHMESIGEFVFMVVGIVAFFLLLDPLRGFRTPETPEEDQEDGEQTRLLRLQEPESDASGAV